MTDQTLNLEQLGRPLAPGADAAAMEALADALEEAGMAALPEPVAQLLRRCDGLDFGEGVLYPSRPIAVPGDEADEETLPDLCEANDLHGGAALNGGPFVVGETAGALIAWQHDPDGAEWQLIDAVSFDTLEKFADPAALIHRLRRGE